MSTRPIVLASTSPYRRGLVDRLGIPFHVAAPTFAETLLEGVDPGELVLTQAEGKARSVAGKCPASLVIGSDQVAVLDGRILGKPGAHDRAVAQLKEMQGREHELMTGVIVLDTETGRTAGHLEVTTIRLRELSSEEIEAYVRRENPIDCAGSYKSEGLGITLFESIQGDDPTAVIGLPLIALCRLLRDFGVDVLNPRG